MAYPNDSVAKTSSSVSSGTISMNTVRNLFFPSGTTALSFSDLYSVKQWFDATSASAYPVWGSLTTSGSGDVSLSNWRGVSARPWVTYSIGSWTVQGDEIGLPFSAGVGEELYGFSNYGYRAVLNTALSFTNQSISSPDGFITSGSEYNRFRQIIYRSAYGTLYVRLSDYAVGTTPSSSLLNSMRWYSSGTGGTVYNMTPIATTSDGAFEPTRIYEFGGDISGIHGTSGSRSILVTNV